jgi:hypothetical protein
MSMPQLCGGVFPERPRKTEQGRVREEKLEIFEMTLTGNLIEDLMATVERAEQRAQSDGASVVEPWFASGQENTDYDSNFLGVA